MSPILSAVIAGVVCLLIGIVVGFQIRKRNSEKEIGSAEQEATRIVNAVSYTHLDVYKRQPRTSPCPPAILRTATTTSGC